LVTNNFPEAGDAHGKGAAADTRRSQAGDRLSDTEN
jgi:hypothetical protein